MLAELIEEVSDEAGRKIFRSRIRYGAPMGELIRTFTYNLLII